MLMGTLDYPRNNYCALSSEQMSWIKTSLKSIHTYNQAIEQVLPFQHRLYKKYSPEHATLANQRHAI